MRKSELKFKLSELAFQVTQMLQRNHPLQENFSIFLKMEFINVYVVTPNYLVQSINLTPQLAGQVFIHASMRR